MFFIFVLFCRLCFDLFVLVCVFVCLFVVFVLVQSVIEFDVVCVNVYCVVNSISGVIKISIFFVEIFQLVLVIECVELDVCGVQLFNDVMCYVVGVSLESSGIDNCVDDFCICGFDVGSWVNNVIFDGMCVLQGSQWNCSMFDSWNLECVEVFKGFLVVMYGQVVLGGMVNQVSKMFIFDQVQQLCFVLDVYGQYSVVFDVGIGSIGNDYLVCLVGLYCDGDMQIKYIVQEYWFLVLSYIWQIVEYICLILFGLYQKDNGGLMYQFLLMVGIFDVMCYGYMKNSIFIGEFDWNIFNCMLWMVGWMVEYWFNDYIMLSQSVCWIYVDLLYCGVVIFGVFNVDGCMQNCCGVQGIGDFDGDMFDICLQVCFVMGGVDYILLFGWDWQCVDWEGVCMVMFSLCLIDIFNLVYFFYWFIVIMEMLMVGVNCQSGVYLQDQMLLGYWCFMLGGCYDWIKDDVISVNCNIVIGIFQFGGCNVIKSEVFIGCVGVLYVFENGLMLYISYVEFFQFLIKLLLDSFIYIVFELVIGLQWEVGVKYQLVVVDGLVILLVYDLCQQNMIVDDLIVSYCNCGVIGIVICFIQGDEGCVCGIELEGCIMLIEGFSLIGVVLCMDLEMICLVFYKGRQLVMVLDYIVLFWVDYIVQGGVFVGLSLVVGVCYNGVSYGDSVNLYWILLYILFDVVICYVLGQVGSICVLFVFNVSNLVDKCFVFMCIGVFLCYYGSGCSVMVIVMFGW